MQLFANCKSILFAACTILIHPSQYLRETTRGMWNSYFSFAPQHATQPKNSQCQTNTHLALFSCFSKTKILKIELCALYQFFVCEGESQKNIQFIVRTILYILLYSQYYDTHFVKFYQFIHYIRIFNEAQSSSHSQSI